VSLSPGRASPSAPLTPPDEHDIQSILAAAPHRAGWPDYRTALELRYEELEAENATLRARVAELESTRSDPDQVRADAGGAAPTVDCASPPLSCPLCGKALERFAGTAP
jgi:hypothetical protein